MINTHKNNKYLFFSPTVSRSACQATRLVYRLIFSLQALLSGHAFVPAKIFHPEKMPDEKFPVFTFFFNLSSLILAACPLESFICKLENFNIIEKSSILKSTIAPHSFL
jgi:hypothetical protein